MPVVTSSRNRATGAPVKEAGINGEIVGTAGRQRRNQECRYIECLLSSGIVSFRGFPPHRNTVLLKEAK